MRGDRDTRAAAARRPGAAAPGLTRALPEIAELMMPGVRISVWKMMSSNTTVELLVMRIPATKRVFRRNLPSFLPASVVDER